MSRRLKDLAARDPDYLEKVVSTLAAFRAEQSDSFQEMIDYDGDDPEVVKAFEGRFTTFVINRICEDPQSPIERHQLHIAMQLGSDMVQLARVEFPDISFNRTSE